VKNRFAFFNRPYVWIAAGIAAVGILAAVFFLANRKGGKDFGEVFGQIYGVKEITFSSPAYSFVLTTENAPVFRLGADYQLAIRERGNDLAQVLGRFNEIELTKDNFERYFTPFDTDFCWSCGFSAAKMRGDNLYAWRLIVPDDPNGVFYYLLRQKNEDLYLTYGYYDAEGETDPYSDDSSIRWIFKLEDEDGDSFSPREVVADGAYVSSSCIYMNPLSSYMNFGDSGHRYEVAADSFIITERISGNSLTISPVDWGWQEFPYTDGEWYAMYSPQDGGDRSIRELYSEILYQPLSEKYFLIRADGELRLVELRGNAKTGEFIWSIYKLVQESAMGFARWEYMPAISSQYPAFRFEFDLRYDEIKAVCTQGGSLISYDENDGEGYPQGYELSVTAGKALYWSPLDPENPFQITPESTSISFTAEDADTMLYAGSIYITRETTCQGTVYIARLVCEGLTMVQNEENQGALITAAE